MKTTLLSLLLCALPLLAADGPTVSYACPDGEAFTVSYQPEKTTPRGTRNARAVVRMEGKPAIALPHVAAASGAKYSDGYTTLWAKGEEAMLESGSVSTTAARIWRFAASLPPRWPAQVPPWTWNRDSCSPWRRRPPTESKPTA